MGNNYGLWPGLGGGIFPTHLAALLDSLTAAHLGLRAGKYKSIRIVSCHACKSKCVCVCVCVCACVHVCVCVYVHKHKYTLLHTRVSMSVHNHESDTLRNYLGSSISVCLCFSSCCCSFCSSRPLARSHSVQPPACAVYGATAFGQGPWSR